MRNIRSVFIWVLGLNGLCILYLVLSTKSDFRSTSQVSNLATVLAETSKTSPTPKKSEISTPNSNISTVNDKSYTFDDPFVAYGLLEKLDIFEIVGDKEIPEARYDKTSNGFKINNNYCKEHRAFFVNHPELVFKNKNFVSNYEKFHQFKKVVIARVGGVDVHPEVQFTDTKLCHSYTIQPRIDVNLYFMGTFTYTRRQIGKQFACLSQEFNHIPGHETIYRKAEVGQCLFNYAKKYESQPECFNYKKYFPKTWILTQKDQCLDFFEEFNGPVYKKLKEERTMVYFRKIGADVHQGRGVFPVNDPEEVHIRNLYKNGSLCGQVEQNNLIQYNIHNLLLINERKFGFRMFMLIASTNPLIAYFHDGYARLSLDTYDPKSNETKTFVTNINVNLKADIGMTYKEIQEDTTWFLEDFQEYMMEKKITKDPNWLDTYIRPELKKIMIHLLRMGQHGFFQKSALFELCGLDFVMDDDLQLWFIEANTKPLVHGFTRESTKRMNKMLVDMIDITLGLLKSRMKRVVVYVNLLTKELGDREEFSNEELEEKRLKFKEITKNTFEPEFKPSPDNGFQRIIDENYYGVERYSGLLEEDCL